MRPCTLLIYTAAKGERTNAAVPPASLIRPQLEKGRVAAVFFAHLYGRKRGKGRMRPYVPPHQYGRNWKKAELRPCDQPHRYGRNWKKAELRPCFSLIYTAAKGKEEECGRAFLLTNTAAIEKRQSCGRSDTPPACRYAPFTFALVCLSSANARFESPCFFQQKRHPAGAFFVERRSGDSNPGAGNPT